MEVAARHNLVLETGHSSPAEAMMLIREAKRLGVKTIVVTHALTNMGGVYNIAQMRQAADLGAWLEIVFGNADVIRASADAVKAIGARSFIISSDLGQPNNPLHPDGLLQIYRGLAQQGISSADIELMSKTNPAKVLGLDPK
jgi:predicted amidohydrolase